MPEGDQILESAPGADIGHAQEPDMAQNWDLSEQKPGGTVDDAVSHEEELISSNKQEEQDSNGVDYSDDESHGGREENENVTEQVDQEQEEVNLSDNEVVNGQNIQVQEEVDEQAELVREVGSVPEDPSQSNSSSLDNGEESLEATGDTEDQGDDQAAANHEGNKVEEAVENNSEEAAADLQPTEREAEVHQASVEQSEESSEPASSKDPLPGFDVSSHTSQDENINYELLQKQVNYVMRSNLLSLPEFRELSDSDKINAILNLIDSVPEIAMSNATPEASGAPSLDQASENARPDLNQNMNGVERKRYSEYLRGENRITEIQNIPPKSRLFIGNLPLKNVAKEDLFRIFSPYGHIYQINIKNAFGFIQYDNPQSVRNAIAGESRHLNFGKKLILEISSSNSRPQYDHGDHGTNSSSTFISSSKRPFDEEEEEDIYSDSSYKRGKRRVPECQIYVKRTADRSYATEVFNKFRASTGLETDMTFLKPRMELRKMINEAAYEGVWGVVLVNKTRNLDIQTFYKGTQGETKFDEYVSVSCEDAIAIYNNMKNGRRRDSGQVQPNAFPPQHQQPQQFYGNYGMPNPSMSPPVQGAPAPPFMQPACGAPPPPGPQSYAGAPIPQGYAGYPPQASAAPLMSPPMAAAPVPNPQLDQQQLLSALQNLPSNVVSGLLSMAHQQPNHQQQLLGIIQSMQPQAQQHPIPHGSPPAPSSYQNYPQVPLQSPNQFNVAPAHVPKQQPEQRQPPQQPPQQQHPASREPTSGNNNVQSLLDSLAQLQQK